MKILIWDDFPKTNTGGPSGYIYNVYEHLKKHPNNQITFLSQLKDSLEKINNNQSENNYVNKQLHNNDTTQIQNLYKYLDNSNNKIIKLSLTVYHFLKRIIKNVFLRYKSRLSKIKNFTDRQFNEPFPEKIDVEILNTYDYIHFHLVSQFSRFVATYPKYKSKTILTSHCPCSNVDEQLNSEKKWMKLFRSFALKNECKAYQKCDYLMFPCEEALEPYFKVNKIRKVLISRKNNIFFVPTAILDIKPHYDYYNKGNLGIPLDAFIITFFGRHNKIKGYDLFKTAGCRLLNNYPNCTIICAGKGDIKPPKHERWIELGFVNNVNDYLSISDLHVIPNIETYFDIATLEALRAGKNVLLSKTGGNKYFINKHKDNISGIRFFNINNIDSLYSSLEKAIIDKQTNIEKYKQEGNNNRSFFLNYFNMSKYINSYIEQIYALK